MAGAGPSYSKSCDRILNHAAGWVVGYALGLFLAQLLSKTPLGMPVGFISLGLIGALFQYPVLRAGIRPIRLFHNHRQVDPIAGQPPQLPPAGAVVGAEEDISP